MRVCLCNFPDTFVDSDVHDLFGRYGRITKVEHLMFCWHIIFVDARDATDAVEHLQGRTINNVKLRLRKECIVRALKRVPNNITSEIKAQSLRLFINGEVTLTNGSKLNIEPIEINVPVKY